MKSRQPGWCANMDDSAIAAYDEARFEAEGVEVVAKGEQWSILRDGKRWRFDMWSADKARHHAVPIFVQGDDDLPRCAGIATARLISEAAYCSEFLAPAQAIHAYAAKAWPND